MPPRSTTPIIVLLLVLAACGKECSRAKSEEPEQSRWAREGGRIVRAAAEEGLSADDRARIAFFEVLTAVYILSLGATVGSFLNVVAYRMPRGLGLLWPPSRCPVCETPIRLRDNVPMLSWLLLRGRCRECRTQISPRYFVVEAITAAIFMTLAYVELLSGGANLPLRPPPARTGVVWILWETQWDLVRIYLYHCGMFSFMLVMSLIRLDGQRLPRTLVAAGFLSGMLFPLAWPDMRPVAANGERTVNTVSMSHGGSAFHAGRGAALVGTTAGTSWQLWLHWQPWSHWKQGLVDGAAGAVVGILLGALLAAYCPKRPEGPPTGTTAALAIVGACLGWQAAMSVTILASALLFVTALASRVSARLTPASVLACLSCATFAHVLFWRWSYDLGGWPETAANWPRMAVAATTAALLAVPTRRLWRTAVTIPAWDSSTSSSKD